MPDSDAVMPGKALSIVVSRCQGCQAMDTSAGSRRCRHCGCEDLVPIDIPGRGKIVSWTVIRRPSGALSRPGPFAVVLVELEAGLRMTANLAGWENEPAPGRDVVAVDEIDGIPIFAASDSSI